MSQFARPSADIFIGSWTNQSGGTTNLYQSIDEIVPSDIDYVECEQLLSNVFGFLSTILVEKLGAVDDPGVDAGFVLRVRVSKDLVNGNEADLVMELRQDYLNEVDPGLLITTLEIFSLTEVATDYEIALTETEAALITNFSNLFLRIRGRVGSAV